MAAFGAQAIGTGLQVIGGLNAMHAQKEEAEASKGITMLEMKADQQRRQAMELSAQRSSLEVTRNAQRARSMGLENATVSGAQFGSGLQGGLAQVQGQATTNQLGISQNLQIGRNIFDINMDISAARIAEANAKGKEATALGISSFGSSISKLGSMGMGMGTGG